MDKREDATYCKINLLRNTNFSPLSAHCKHTTLQSWAPLWDVQPQNRAGSLVGWDGRTQHAIGWSVEEEIIDTGTEKWLGVKVQVTGSEWATGVCDDATELGKFFPEGAVVQSITIFIICGSTSRKRNIMMPLVSAAVFIKLSYMAFHNSSPWLACGCLPAVSKLIVVLCQCAIG